MIVPFFSALFVPTTNESRSKKMSLRHMAVNGECQLCQSKSNCLRTNLALLNLHLMFSPPSSSFQNNYQIALMLCCYLPENGN